jgi:hypothetical protein
LKQPRIRRRAGPWKEEPDEAYTLRRQCDLLTKENDELKRLIEVLRGLPRLSRDAKEAGNGKGASAAKS